MKMMLAVFLAFLSMNSKAADPEARVRLAVILHEQCTDLADIARIATNARNNGVSFERLTAAAKTRKIDPDVMMVTRAIYEEPGMRYVSAEDAAVGAYKFCIKAHMGEK